MQNYLLTTLPSGARVISEPLETVRSVAIGLWIGTGSRDEDDAHAGVTHFLEHLLFKGTARRSAREIAESVESVGGDMNAFTTHEQTVFYVRLPDTQLAIGRLLRNQAQIGNAVKPFYGRRAGNRLTALLQAHINAALALLQAAKSGDAAAIEEIRTAFEWSATRVPRRRLFLGRIAS